jgi:hypothetical protein
MGVWHCDRHDRIVRWPLQGTRQPARVPPGARVSSQRAPPRRDRCGVRVGQGRQQAVRA